MLCQDQTTVLHLHGAVSPVVWLIAFTVSSFIQGLHEASCDMTQ